MENLFVLLVLFVWGTFFGSFLNVLIDRLSTDRPFIKGRSYCENCKKTLSPIELIPLFSYLIQRGKCRHCNAEIPFRLFLVELMVGLLLPAIYIYSLNNQIPLMQSILLGIITYSFIGIFFADLKYGIIPDTLVILSLLSTLFYLFYSDLGFINHILSALSSFAFFFLLFAITRGRGMGFGDVKFAFVLGLLLGFPMTILALYTAFLTGAFVSIILVIWRKVSYKKGTIPFGPFLIFSTILSMFYGKTLLLPLVMKFF